jgi:hypothetical protein
MRTSLGREPPLCATHLCPAANLRDDIANALHGVDGVNASAVSAGRPRLYQVGITFFQCAVFDVCRPADVSTVCVGGHPRPNGKLQLKPRRCGDQPCRQGIRDQLPGGAADSGGCRITLSMLRRPSLTRSADARFGARPPMCGLVRSSGDCSHSSGRPANIFGATAGSVDMLDSPTTPACTQVLSRNLPCFRVTLRRS